MNLQLQTQALLDLVEADRASRISAIRCEAQSRADALLTLARAEARTRLRQAFAEQRALRQERLAAAVARRDTQRRLQAQQHTQALLQLARQRLPGELIALWQSPAQRAAWVTHVVAAARAHVGETSWCITHPQDWPPDEQQALARQIQASGGAAPSFVADSRLRAGLRIAAGGNVIDGTLEGLLAEHADFEARLLRRLEGAR